MVKSYIRLKRVLILFVVENPHSQSAVLVGPIILVLVCSRFIVLVFRVMPLAAST
jgi:hypothetical protein